MAEYIYCEADHLDGKVCLTRHIVNRPCPNRAEHADNAPIA